MAGCTRHDRQQRAREDESMPIMMRYIEGRFWPLVLCDFCGERIADASDGNVVWVADEAADRPLFFTHKACDHAFESANPAPESSWGWYWCPLEALPIQLGTNLKVKWKEAREAARDWSSDL